MKYMSVRPSSFRFPSSLWNNVSCIIPGNYSRRLRLWWLHTQIHLTSQCTINDLTSNHNLSNFSLTSKRWIRRYTKTCTIDLRDWNKRSYPVTWRRKSNYSITFVSEVWLYSIRKLFVSITFISLYLCKITKNRPILDYNLDPRVTLVL